ncbi:hypothetical protein [Azospirillum sp. sgz302134]
MNTVPETGPDEVVSKMDFDAVVAALAVLTPVAQMLHTLLYQAGSTTAKQPPSLVEAKELLARIGAKVEWLLPPAGYRWQDVTVSPTNVVAVPLAGAEALPSSAGAGSLPGKIAKTILTVTILHPVDESPEGKPLDAIGRELDDGGWIGQIASASVTAVSDDRVRDELIALGNDGTFFDTLLDRQDG